MFVWPRQNDLVVVVPVVAIAVVVIRGPERAVKVKMNQKWVWLL